METQEPLWRLSKGLGHSCEKLIFLPYVGGGVGSRYVHYICESVPMLPINFSLKGQHKPCWNMPLKPTNLFTAVSQNPNPFPFFLAPYNVLWMLATAPSLGRVAAEGREVLNCCWRFLSFLCHCQHAFSPASHFSEAKPEKTGQDLPPWKIHGSQGIIGCWW